MDGSLVTATTWIALYAAVLSTVSLIYIVRREKSRRATKVTVSVEKMPLNDDYEFLSVQVINNSEHSVRPVIIGIECQDGTRLGIDDDGRFFKIGGLINSQIEPDDGKVGVLTREGLLSLAEVIKGDTIVVFVDLSTKEEFKSKPVVV